MRNGSRLPIVAGVVPLPLAMAIVACGTTAPAPQAAVQLAGTQWNVAEIDGKPPIGADLTAQFSIDGRVSGNSGCNQFSGAYTQAGDQVRFGELLSTRRACVDADRQRQETRVLGILAGETTVRQERRELRIRGANGTLVLSPGS